MDKIKTKGQKTKKWTGTFLMGFLLLLFLPVLTIRGEDSPKESESNALQESGGMEGNEANGAELSESFLIGTPSPDRIADLQKTRSEMVDYGIEYLRHAQEEEGGFSSRMGIGPTLIVLIGLLRSDLSPDDAMIRKGLDFILKSVQEDGGIYSPGARIASYESCLALSCLQLAKDRSGSPDYDRILENGERFIRGEQYSGENGVSRDDPRYGGLGYGEQTRPDLSNTQFFVETLIDLGADADDEAIQNALLFVSRCQNFREGEGTTDGEGAENGASDEAIGDDGGFVYTRLGDGENPAGQEVSGGLRSYGSISYAGLKSLIYAGLTPDDPRVAAAMGWIRENYSVTNNPGLGRRGLYYYYHTMSKTMDILGKDLFLDADGKDHYWKGELIQVLADAQRPDGSWMNDNRMWMENDPKLATGYALIVLSYCKE